MKKTAASDETTASDCRQTLDKNEVCLFFVAKFSGYYGKYFTQLANQQLFLSILNRFKVFFIIK